ncbi:hypothetical protein [Caballeronia sp.]|uniref:hypothetical protein n=1 Tax=Caballeronia sp. TaxID=1931223 RepID=UPI003C33E9EF
MAGSVVAWNFYDVQSGTSHSIGCQQLACRIDIARGLAPTGVPMGAFLQYPCKYGGAVLLAASVGRALSPSARVVVLHK